MSSGFNSGTYTTTNPEKIIALAKSLSDFNAPNLEFKVPEGFSYTPNFSTGSGAALAPNLDSVSSPVAFSPTAPDPYYQIEVAAYNAVEGVRNLPVFTLPASPENSTAETIGDPSTFGITPITGPPTSVPVAAYLDAVDEAPAFEALPAVNIRRGELPNIVEPTDTNFVPVELAPYGAAPADIPDLSLTDTEFTPPPEVDLTPILSAVSEVYTQAGWTTAEQRALVDDATRGLENQRAEAFRSQAAEVAARGFFSLTPGAIEAMKKIAEEATAAQAKASEAIETENHTKAIDITRAAGDLELRLDEAVLSGYLAQVEAQLRVQRFNVQAHVQLYNALVDMYNARVSAYNEQASDYSAYLNAVGGQNDAVGDDLTTRAAKVGVFTSKTRAIAVQHDVAAKVEQAKSLGPENDAAYLAQKNAAGYYNDANLAIQRSNIGMYGEAISAYSRRTQLDSAAFTAAAAGTQARASAAAVVAGNARNVARAEAAGAAIASVDVSVRRDAMAALEAQVGLYREYLGAKRSEVTTAAAEISSAASVWREYYKLHRERGSYLSNLDAANVALVAAENSVANARAETSVTQQALNAQAAAAQARIDAGLLGAKATAAAGKAQAALAITSTNMRLSGSVGTSSSTGDNASTSYNEGASRSWGSYRSESASVSG